MSEALIFGERRLHERKDCYFYVDVNDYHNTFTGHLRNLSLGGALMDTPNHRPPEVGQDIILTIPFRRRPDCLVIKGRISRVRPDGVGIRFLDRHSR